MNPWAPRWHPPNAKLNKILNELLLKVRQLARQAENQLEIGFDEDTLDQSTKAHPKNTKGIDSWTNTELQKVPTKVRKRISSSIRYSFKKSSSTYPEHAKSAPFTR